MCSLFISLLFIGGITVVYTFVFVCAGPVVNLYSFPTRRSSDLTHLQEVAHIDTRGEQAVLALVVALERSEEHTSELQSRGHLVCRLLLEKKNYRRFVYFTVVDWWDKCCTNICRCSFSTCSHKIY